MRDLLSYVRLVTRPQDAEAFETALNVPDRGIGATYCRAIAHTAARCGTYALDIVFACVDVWRARDDAKAAHARAQSPSDEAYAREMDAEARALQHIPEAACLDELQPCQTGLRDLVSVVQGAQARHRSGQMVHAILEATAVALNFKAGRGLISG